MHSLSTKIGVKFQLLFCHTRRHAVTVKIQRRNTQAETQLCVSRLKVLRYVYMLTYKLRSRFSRFATQKVYKESLACSSNAENTGGTRYCLLLLLASSFALAPVCLLTLLPSLACPCTCPVFLCPWPPPHCFALCSCLGCLHPTLPRGSSCHCLPCRADRAGRRDPAQGPRPPSPCARCCRCWSCTCGTTPLREPRRLSKAQPVHMQAACTAPTLDTDSTALIRWW